MLQGSATTGLMVREVERLAVKHPVSRCAASPSICGGRPDCAPIGVETEMLRDGRKAKTIQVRLLDGETEIGRCTALLTAQGSESPADPFSKVRPAPTLRPKPAPRRRPSRRNGAAIFRTCRCG